MNQDQVKEQLQKIRPSADFHVVFSGKKSKKVNGLYKPESREIIIHNQNFTDNNMLLYTAIHEYAHHVHFTDGKHAKPSARAHTTVFWSIFHDLLDKAVSVGIYREAYRDDKELSEMAENIRDDLHQIGELIKNIGRNLIAAAAVCAKKNVRFEDFVDRALQMNRVTARLFMKAFQLNLPASLGPDGLRLVASIRGNDERTIVSASLENGKSQDQAKAARKAEPLEPPEEMQEKRLKQEKVRLEKTISSLERRLEEVERELGDISAVDEAELDMKVG
jgi:hypothetical protein